ncbi:AraC family transcriptional regulator [Paenibacillus oryzisoli]|uniref:helix-turn-helix domain-containing protein n=1 Tax=Paenibacillus oryzisoli TaxID=1850517 RepID=UPI003D2E10F8
MPNVAICRSYFSGVRTSFNLEEDLYKNWVLLAAQSGSFSFQLGAGEAADTKLIKAGELVLCPPGTPLKRWVVDPLTFIFIEFTSDSPYPTGKITVKDVQRLTSTFTYMRQVSLNNQADPSHADYMNHLLQDLLRMIDWERKLAGQTIPRDQLDPISQRALAYLDLHAFDESLNLQHLAQELGLSASQLTRRFQDAYKLSPIAYVTTIRLRKACALLVETDDTLEAIAEQCGYQNAFYFSRMFKKKQQISPSTYRRTYRI